MPSFVRKLSKFTKKEIDTAFESAIRVAKLTQITILRAPRQLPFGRILIITPKIVGSAPIRNKLRRQLKALFYENRLFDLPYDWIIIAKAGAGKLAYDWLKNFFLTTLKSSGVS
jgi:ribonuclease P protein component